MRYLVASMRVEEDEVIDLPDNAVGITLTEDKKYDVLRVSWLEPVKP